MCVCVCVCVYYWHVSILFSQRIDASTMEKKQTEKNSFFGHYHKAKSKSVCVCVCVAY